MSTKKPTTNTNTNTKAEAAPATKPAENKVDKKATEKIVFKKMYRGMRGCFDPGQVAEVPADFAAAMVAAGLAEKC